MQLQSINNVKQQLTDQLQSLNLLSCNEHSFLKLESLFYDVLSLARLQSSTAVGNLFLFNLKGIQQKEFQSTQQFYAKATQRENAIRKFKNALKKEMSSYLKIVKNIM